MWSFFWLATNYIHFINHLLVIILRLVAVVVATVHPHAEYAIS